MTATTAVRPSSTKQESARPRRRGAGGRSLSTGLLFLAPAVLALVLLRLLPTVQAVRQAFEPSSSGGHLATFHYLFADPDFLSSILLTLLFSVVLNPVQILLALGLALLMSRPMPGLGLWRTLILLPVAIPQAVSAVIWAVILRPDGPLNGALARLGLPPVPWLTDPHFSLLSIMIILSWVGVGYWMTFLIGAIQDVPESLYEAARLDGAGAWSRFRYVTLPGITRVLLFVLVADTVSNFLIFAPVQILTQGGPAGSTDLLMFQIYQTAYVNGDFQAASAATLVLTVIVLIVVGLQFRMMSERQES